MSELIKDLPEQQLFTKLFASKGSLAEITDKEWEEGWNSIVNGNNGIPTTSDFNLFGYILEYKINTLYNIVNSKGDSITHYSNFSDINSGYNENTSIVSVIRSMEAKSILIAHVKEANNRYPADLGELRIEKYSIDTAVLEFSCSENGVSTKYHSVVTPENIETIFGGVS